MYAVVRETNYAPEQPIYETPEFREFQHKHAGLNGYEGTVVVEVDAGRFLTLTPWRSAEDMAAARQAIGPVVQRTVDPLMTARARLLRTNAAADTTG